MIQLTYKRGDHPTPTPLTLSDTAGPVDLTGATIRWLMRPPEGGPLTLDRAATITDAATGQIEIPWEAGDLDVAGVWYAEAEATWADAKVTFPNDSHIIVRVRDDLDPEEAP